MTIFAYLQLNFHWITNNLSVEFYSMKATIKWNCFGCFGPESVSEVMGTWLIVASIGCLKDFAVVEHAVKVVSTETNRFSFIYMRLVFSRTIQSVILFANGVRIFFIAISSDFLCVSCCGNLMVIKIKCLIWLVILFYVDDTGLEKRALLLQNRVNIYTGRGLKLLKQMISRSCNPSWNWSRFSLKNVLIVNWK